MTNSALPATSAPVGRRAAAPRVDLTTARTLTHEAFTTQGEQCWGLEQEWVLRHPGDPQHRPGFADLRPVLARPLPGKSRITVEPGGQVELSTTPHRRVDDALDALEQDREELALRLAGRGWVMVDDALDLTRPPRRILAEPRYRCMEAFFDSCGPAGRWMMCNTAALQVNVSHDRADPAARWHLVHRLGPVLLAVFACSPGIDSGGHQWASLRQGIWSAIDPARTRPVATGDPGLAWLDYALTTDILLIRDADSAQAQQPGIPFGRWMAGDTAHRAPTVEDLRYHLTTLFPPVRPRGWLELRMIDALPAAVREVATLVVAAALHPRAAADLRSWLPDTSGWWLDAARYGLTHDGLAEAAGSLFQAVHPVLAEVTGRPDRIAAVREYASNHVADRLQPWGGRADEPAARTQVELTRRPCLPR
jgi:glutamate--cysteine ligase